MKRTYLVKNVTQRPIFIGFAPRQKLVLLGASKEIDRGERPHLTPGQEITRELEERDVAAWRQSGDLQFTEVKP